MKILVVADIHGEFGQLSKALGKTEATDIDLVICPGDFTDTTSPPQGFSQLDIGEIIIQNLKSLRKPVLCVPGNNDPYELVDLFEEYKVNLHGKKKTFQRLDFIGWGGAQTPFNTPIEPTEEETSAALKGLIAQAKNDTVVVLHSPPKNTKLDLLPGGKHVGSQAARDFITKNNPLLSISAHIHENPGVDRLGSTVLFYPGQLAEGRYGIVTITNKTIKCELKKAAIQ